MFNFGPLDVAHVEGEAKNASEHAWQIDYIKSTAKLWVADAGKVKVQPPCTLTMVNGERASGKPFWNPPFATHRLVYLGIPLPPSPNLQSLDGRNRAIVTNSSAFVGGHISHRTWCSWASHSLCCDSKRTIGAHARNSRSTRHCGMACES